MLPRTEWLDEETAKMHKELRYKHDWWHHMNPVRRFLLHCARLIVKYNVWSQAEDTHCFIDCECGNHMSIGDAWITWCPYCGRGYSTDFVLYYYPPALMWKPEHPEIAMKSTQLNMQGHVEVGKAKQTLQK